MAGDSASPTTIRSHERWETLSEWLLTVAAMAFLVAYAWPILDPTLPSVWVTVCRIVAWGAWALFAVEYLARLVSSRDRPAFVRGHLLDLLVIALPLLRPLRLLRLVTLLSVLGRNAGGSLRGRVVVFVTGATLLVLFIAGLAVLDAERGADGANIESFPDALWWALTTITTVGYGDRFPVTDTDTGRMVAAGLMV